MRGWIVPAALLAVSGCYYTEGPQAEQADAIIFYPPDARIDGPPDAPIDITSCVTELPCPPSPDPARVNVCGRIFDVESNLLVGAPLEGAVCRPGMTDGACRLEILPYHALAFAGDTDIPPLPFDRSYLDTCGRFQLENVRYPDLGYLGLGVDDVGGADDFGKGGLATQVFQGESRGGLVMYAISHTTDATWSSAANLVGDSLVERGAILAVFTRDGAPVEGVVVTEGGAPDVANDYYFSDTTPDTRRSVDPLRAATGPNGSALLLNSGLVEHSGTGGETDGCRWSSGLATTIGGVLLHMPRECE